MTRKESLREAVAGLPPASFALVMATGIVSIASELVGLGGLARVLLPLNVAFFAALWVLTGLRAALFGRRLLQDLGDHARGMGAFTAVAASCVLGAQVLALGGPEPAAVGLWVLGLLLWLLLTYGVITALTVKREKPDLVAGLNGGWLLSIVATQGLVVLGVQLAAGLEESREIFLFAMLATWLGGGMLYLWIISLIFYRYTFFPMSPADLAPPYWINMGAAAITTLAGTLLAARSPDAALLAELLPFIKGLTIFFWASATWWIPMLALLGFWRHVLRRFPFRYHSLYWGMVFPLGMYTACTHRLAAVLDLPDLAAVPRVFIWIALAAWSIVLFGLLRSLLRLLRQVPRPA